MSRRWTFVAAVAVISIVALAPALQAQLTLGPPAANKYPQWIADPTGLKVQLGLQTRNARDPHAGPTLFLKRGAAIIEAGYWMGEADIADPFFKRALLIMGIEAEVLPGTGPALFNIIRFRLEPATPNGLPTGTYTVDTPFGSFSFVVDAVTPKQNTDRVDILVGRDAGGALVAGIENAIDVLPVAAGTPLPGPVTHFPRAANAPLGFLGDMGIVPAPPRSKPGPAPTGPQRLLDAPSGSTFRIHMPDGVTVFGAAPGETDFLVQGSIFEDANAAAALTATLNRGVLTVRPAAAGAIGNTAFDKVLPRPATPSATPGISTFPAAAGVDTVVPFSARFVFPPKIALIPAGGGLPVVKQIGDSVTATATWSATRGGTLTIKARSSFAKLPAADRPTLTATVGGVQHQLNRAGNIVIRGAANPGTVTVTSSQGNTATNVVVTAR